MRRESLSEVERCEYCHIPQRFFSQFFQLEHIVARQHRGTDDVLNLCLACRRCNLHKGPNLSGVDPVTAELTRLFHPREENWEEHFRIDDMGEITGLTAVGRTTAYVLSMNTERRMRLRRAIRLLEGEAKR